MYEKYETLLKLRGVKTAQVSRETGIPPSTFTDWKKGRVKNISPSSLKKIADYFEVPVSYFYGDDENKQYYTNLATNYLAEKLREDQKALMRSAVDLTPEEVKAVDMFIRVLKGEVDD